LSVRNAHPFRQGAIVGAHNGTIHHGLDKLPGDKEKLQGTTDSEKLYLALSTGAKLQEVIDKVTGAAALTWWNSEDRTFNLYRNAQRPLFYCWNKASGNMYYASEKWMIEKAAEIAKVHDAKDIIELPVNKHIRWCYNDSGDRIVETEETEVTQFTTPFQQTQNMHGGGGFRGTTSTGIHNGVNTYGEQNPKYTNHKIPGFLSDQRNAAPAAGNSVIPFGRLPSGWLDMSSVTLEEFNKATKFGCCMCTRDLYYDDNKIGKVRWLQRETPFCLDCASGFNKSK
jgi:hypothetical protein